MILSQLIANGIIAGAITALVTAGFALIYATNKFVHLAHGVLVIAGGYLFYSFTSVFGMSVAVAAFCTVVGTALLGLICFYGVYYPLRRRNASRTILLIASIGLMILIENILFMIFGPGVTSVDFIMAQSGQDIWGASVTTLQMVMVGISLVLVAGLGVFIKFSHAGTVLRAVADNPELAEITGIHSLRAQALSFGIGSALGGVAGILIILEQNVSPTMGTNLVIRAFTSAVIGGLGSLPGAIMGSYLLGLIENIGIWFLPSSYKDAIAFVLLLIFLLFRPQGLFGINKGTRE